MSSVLLVLFGGATPEAILHWVRVNRASGDILQQGELGPDEKAPTSAPADTVLVIPGSEAQLKSVQLSASSDVQARAAAAYLFEGALAIEKEHAAFALGAAANGRRLVAAVDRRRLQRWIGRCNDAGLNPASILLDSAIWPVRSGAVQIVDLGGHAIVAAGELGSFAIESDLVLALLPAWLAQTPSDVAVIEAMGIDASILAGRLVQPAPSVEQVTLPHPLAVLCRAAASPPSHAPDLRQGEFAIARRKSTGFGAWGLAAGLAIVAAGLQLGVMAADGVSDAQAAAALTASNEATFMQLHPETKGVTNLRAQVTAALNAVQRPKVNPAISSSSVVTGVLRSHPEVRLEEVRSDAPGKLITLRFSSLQSPALDAAMADLGAAMTNLKIGQMQTTDGRVNLTVSAKAS